MSSTHTHYSIAFDKDICAVYDDYGHITKSGSKWWKHTRRPCLHVLFHEKGQKLVEHMIKLRTKGVIINISSICACGNEGQTAYSAAKAGVNAMTVTWSKELGRWGIRTNAVAPGFIGTDSTRDALNEVVLKHIQSNTPLRRLGQAEEVAQAVITLIKNDFINGIVLDVNGGLRI